MDKRQPIHSREPKARAPGATRFESRPLPRGEQTMGQGLYRLICHAVRELESAQAT